MPLYDYRCSQGHVSESLQAMGVESICCACGLPAERQGAYRVAVVSPYVDSRGMYRRYVDATSEMAHTAEKTGTPMPSPYAAAKERVRAMVASGEATVSRERIG